MSDNLATRFSELERALLGKYSDKSTERFRQFVLNMPIMMDALDEDNVVVAWNREAERVTGFTADEMIGNPKALELIYPDKEYRERMLSQWMHRASDYRDWEWYVRCKDGSQKVVAWSNISKSFPIPGWANWSIGIDITDKKRAEETVRKSEERLGQSQKMEAIGTLASGIAHDFNNILAGIFACADMALMLLPENHPAARNIRELQTAGERAKGLIKRILTFSRKGEPIKTAVEIQSVVSDCIKLIRASLPSTIEIVEQLNASEKLILGDPTEIQQVILNLSANAAYAMKSGQGILAIGLDEVYVDSDLLEILPELSPGLHIRLSVRDSGTGMRPEVISRIFEPYFTTKPIGEGTGIGLAMVHGIVKSYGGAINVASKVNRGTLFEVYLPQIKTAPKNLPRNLAKLELTKGDARILYVDDEVMLATIGKQALELLGYSVNSVTSSTEALKIFKESPDAFDLVITDFTMPQMTGTELANHLLQLRPNLAVIICSGQIDVPQIQITNIDPKVEYLCKPFTIKELSDTVHRLLMSGAFD